MRSKFDKWDYFWMGVMKGAVRGFFLGMALVVFVALIYVLFTIL